MGDQCYEACVAVLRKYAYMSRIQATTHLRRMRLESRWQYDLWGTSNLMDDDYADSKRSIRKDRANRAVMWLNKVQSTRLSLLENGEGDDDDPW